MNATATPLREDLEAAWEAAKASFGAQDFVGLVKAGVPKRFLAENLYGSLWLGADDIRIDDGRWVRRFRGDRAVVLPVLGGGEIVDLVAFRLETPKAFWLLTGAGIALGADEIDRAEIMREALPVHECPLDWLRAEMFGLCILDFAHPWSGLLAGVPALKFDDRTFGRRAEALIQKPYPTPMILVPAA
jgi:hypothetical protein